MTGLVLAGTDLFYPPIGAWIADHIAAPNVDPTTLVLISLVWSTVFGSVTTITEKITAGSATSECSVDRAGGMT